MTETLPNLLSEFPQTAPISLLEDNSNPFDDVERAPPAEKLWSFTFIDRTAYLEKFASLGPVAGKLNGQSCKPAFEEFGHDKAFLSKTWMLSDWTKDGYLDSDEFVVAMWLCEMKKRNWITELPDVLPITMVPNYKRG